MIFFIWNKYFLYLYLLYFKVEENADFSPIHPSTNPTENFYFHYSVLCYFIFLKFIRLLPIYPQRASSIDFFIIKLLNMDHKCNV